MLDISQNTDLHPRVSPRDNIDESKEIDALTSLIGTQSGPNPNMLPFLDDNTVWLRVSVDE